MLREHAWHALALVLGVSEVNQHAHNAWVAAPVDTLQPEHLFQGHAFWKCTCARHFHAIFKHPDLGACPLNGVVPVGDGVVYGLAPGKIRVLRHLPKAGAQETGRSPQKTADLGPRLVQHHRQIAFDARPFLHIVFHAIPPRSADDPKNSDARVRMIRFVLGEEEFGGAPKQKLMSPAVGELAPKQVFLVRPGRETGPGTGAGQQLQVKVVQCAGRTAGLPALVHALPLGRGNQGFPGSDGPVAYTKRETVARHLDRHVRRRNIEHNQFDPLVRDSESPGLGRIQEGLRCR